MIQSLLRRGDDRLVTSVVFFFFTIDYLFLNKYDKTHEQ